MFKFISFAVLLGAICIGDAAVSTSSPHCTRRNEYSPVEGSCDSYIECRDFVAQEMLCPDGLHFNPKAEWPAYPCGYPMDVPCQGRGAPQPASPTADCPHQYGFYPSPLASSNNCSPYRMCVEGRAIEMICPPGLAFNPANAQCDWPDLVESCNAEAYLGFKCPPAPLGEDGLPLDVIMNYRYDGNCYAFFSCQHGHAPRLLTCDPGFAFDATVGECVDAQRVNCAEPVAVPQ